MLSLRNNQTGLLGSGGGFSLNDFCCSVVSLSFKRFSRLGARGMEAFLFALLKVGIDKKR